MISIRKSLSTKLSLSILLLAAPIFIVSLGVLFSQSRHIILSDAIGRANSALDVATQRVVRNLIMIETATNANSWLAEQDMRPQALLDITRKVVALNMLIDGCSISAEPGEFPEYGKYFSAYSVRMPTSADSLAGSSPDSISTVVEEQYEYFGKIWYRTPRDLKAPCWVVYYDESDSLEVTIDGLIASYGKPLYDSNGHFAAIISTDLSLRRLSRIISSEVKPYPNAYFMMVGKEGNYLIHPDSTRLFTKTLFSDVDPHEQADIIVLGHEMTKGGRGSMAAVIDGVDCLVCYKPVPGTDWSFALVCPNSDILAGYRKQLYIIGMLLVVGLFVILVICHRAVSHAIRPVNQLLEKTQSIAEGNMEIHIPHSQRADAIGRLQNSFATMLQSLNFHMGSVRYTTEQAIQRNEELEQTTRLALEAERQKTSFIQNVTHQIRTPLNIIMGFAQILRDSSPLTAYSQRTVAEGKGGGQLPPDGHEMMSEEEVKSVVDMMDYNAKLLQHLVKMLFYSSETGLSEELKAVSKLESVGCNDIAREAIAEVQLRTPLINIDFKTEVNDELCIMTNRHYLTRALEELLYNATKYSDRQHISLSISLGDAQQQPPSKGTLRYVVEDTGNGIAAADRERMFMFFTKINDLSEGLGLGLPLAKRHAQNLGGDLTLDENYHEGCRFILELPLTPDAPSTADAPSKADAPSTADAPSPVPA